VLRDLTDTGIIAGTQGTEQDIVLPRICQHQVPIGPDRLQLPLPVGPVDHPRLAETASPDAAPLQLHRHAVLCHGDKGNQGFRRIRGGHGIIQVRLDLPPHPRRDIRVLGPKGRNEGLFPVFLFSGAGVRQISTVAHFIQGGHIDPGDLRGCAQKRLPPCFPLLHLTIEVEQGVVGGLPLPDIKQIKKIRHRFRIAGAGAASDHQGILLRPVLRQKGDPRQVQDLEDICIAQFELERDPQKIKTAHRIL